MPTPSLLVLAAVVGLAHIAARLAGRPAIAAALKAVPVWIAAAWAASLTDPVSAAYQRWIVVGLLFGSVGDLCLLADRTFVHGLASFLVGHVCYLMAFAVAGSGVAPGALVLCGVLTVAVLAVLWNHVGRLRPAVGCYVAVIAAMAWRALARWETPGVPAASGGLAAAGAIAFLVSDAVLAIDRFVGRLPGGSVVIMVTYYAAQLALAASVAA